LDRRDEQMGVTAWFRVLYWHLHGQKQQYHVKSQQDCKVLNINQTAVSVEDEALE
jgi:hypothetical protein